MVRSRESRSVAARRIVSTPVLAPCPRILVQAAHLVAELLAVVVDQRVGHRLQVAGDDLVEVVQREADAVVGEAVLREVVGANPLAAVAGADERLALGGPLGVFLLLS